MGCMQNEGVPSSGYSEIRRLMETGEPVCITFETEEGDVKKRLHGTMPFQKTNTTPTISFTTIAPRKSVMSYNLL